MGMDKDEVVKILKAFLETQIDLEYLELMAKMGAKRVTLYRVWA